MICLVSDFGLSDRFASILKGVAYSVDLNLNVSDITHEITPFNVLEGAWILAETMKFWPAGTSFVAVVDPGVGSMRKALAIKTRKDQYIYCPDNGIITFVEIESGLKEVRVIDIEKNHYSGAPISNTFHGRDIFIYNAARVASGKIRFEDLGFLFAGSLVRLVVPEPEIHEKKVTGIITHVEEPFGNLCTNISADLLRQKRWKAGDKVKVSVLSGGKILWTDKTRFVKTFSDMKPGVSLIYIDSTQKLGIAKNSSRIFKHGIIQPGVEIKVVLEKMMR